VLDLENPLARRLFDGLWGLGAELVNAFHYLAWAPALLGVWWFRGMVRREPGVWAILIFCGLHALVLWRLAVVVGYLSDRHVLVLVLCGIYPAVAAVWELPGWLLGVAGAAAVRRMAWFSVAGLLALTAVGLPKTLQTLHGKRAGYHAAGVWLAAHAHPSDVILDRHAWAHFYAGRMFLEGEPVPAPADHPRTCYHVIGKKRDAEREAAGPFPAEAEVLARGGRLVFHWPANRPPERATVVVYAVRHDHAPVGHGRLDP
jgi:hypothetical protein